MYIVTSVAKRSHDVYQKSNWLSRRISTFFQNFLQKTRSRVLNIYLVLANSFKQFLFFRSTSGCAWSTNLLIKNIFTAHSFCYVILCEYTVLPKNRVHVVILFDQHIFSIKLVMYSHHDLTTIVSISSCAVLYIFLSTYLPANSFSLLHERVVLFIFEQLLRGDALQILYYNALHLKRNELQIP